MARGLGGSVGREGGRGGVGKVLGVGEGVRKRRRGRGRIKVGVGRGGGHNTFREVVVMLVMLGPIAGIV